MQQAGVHEGASATREDKKDNKKSKIVNLTNSQKFVSSFFTPDSIYKGILFWHSVGTGKTCSAIATASSTFEKENYTILWVTRHTLKQDIWKNIFKDVCSATIKEQIEELKALLTGDLFQDGDIMQKIYELKKQLNPEIETNPEADDDEDGCLFCGS